MFKLFNSTFFSKKIVSTGPLNFVLVVLESTLRKCLDKMFHSIYLTITTLLVSTLATFPLLIIFYKVVSSALKKYKLSVTQAINGIDLQP
jgi:ABC-type phosphate/phosphonate transport system permease subunit